jgi:hypothetical protein
VVANGREKLSVSERAAEILIRGGLISGNCAEVREKYQNKISNRFVALENLCGYDDDDDVDLGKY